MKGTEPTKDMLQIAERVAIYMSTKQPGILEDLFSPNGVTIFENFPPYIFEGVDAGAKWAAAFASYAQDLDIVHKFGEAQNFSVTGNHAFFTLPTNWTGTDGSRKFTENGGWLFILERVNDHWTLRGYGWAVTEFKYLD